MHEPIGKVETISGLRRSEIESVFIAMHSRRLVLAFLSVSPVCMTEKLPENYLISALLDSEKIMTSWYRELRTF